MENASEEAEAAPGSPGASSHPGGPCRQLHNGAGPAAPRDPARTCLGQCYFFIPHLTEGKTEADPFGHFSRHSWSVHTVSAPGVLWQERQTPCIAEEKP